MRGSGTFHLVYFLINTTFFRLLLIINKPVKVFESFHAFPQVILKL